MRSILPLLLLLACPSTVEPPLEEALADPGRVTLHRLNRAEYDNTVRDLLGLDLGLAGQFPPDDFGYGYDNIADVLATSPLLFELWERSAQTVAEAALRETLVAPVSIHVEAEDPSNVSTTGTANGFGWVLWANGALSATIEAPGTGTYTFSARMRAEQAGSELAQAALAVDSASVGVFDIAGETEDEAEIVEVEVELEAGEHEIAVAFLNDYWDPPTQSDRNLYVDWMRLVGPFGPLAAPNPARQMLLTCEPGPEPEGCLAEVLAPTARRAWRRPLADGELDRLVALASIALQDGDSFDAAVALGLRGILTSPHFVFRVEIDDDPTSEAPHPLSPHELATRLSYFLWSSMPDEALFDAADADELRTAEQITAQVRRMLDDARARALVDNFAGQWLWIRAVGDSFADPVLFPTFDPSLRDAMQEEMERYVARLLAEDRSMLELLVGEDTFVNPRLAEHYGVEPPADWAAVEVPGRGGVLTQAGLLFATSQPNRTSPVRRGVWVLEHLLCGNPGTPPAGVEGLPEDDIATGELSQRQILEQHRADPACAACHDTIDPLGLGLENFHVDGSWRDFDGDEPVDASGELPDGRTFEGAQELSALLVDDPDLPACMAEQLFTYALGRGPRFADREALGDITDAFAAGGHTFESLAVAIATSPTFRQRRGEAE